MLLLTKQGLGQEADAIGRTIAATHPGVVFRNVTYEDICRAVEGLFKDYEEEMAALVEDYIEYCNDADLFDQSKYLMRIAPCGESVALNKKYGIYFNPRDRGYTKHSFVGVYANKAVQTLWQIDSVFDVQWDGATLTKEFVEGRDTRDYDDKLIAIIKEAQAVCGYDITTGRRFFCGVPMETDYRKSSSGGILGARFINLRDVVGDFADSSEAAMKLRGKYWE